MGRLLSRGTTGLDVSELQAALNFHIRSPVVPLKPDGRFGSLTDARVRDFQRLAKLMSDGVVGPITIAALYRTLAGAVDVGLKPRPVLGGAPLTMRRGFGSDRPTNPLLLMPQTGRATSPGFATESKLTFNPFAKPSLGDHPLKVTIDGTFPWPILLPEPLQLQVDAGMGEKVELDAKIKQPFKIKLLQTPNFELKPYFFTGAGMDQNHFKDINAGAGAVIKIKLFKDIGGTGTSLGLEADGGLKFKHDFEKNEGKFKGYLEGSVLLIVPF